MRRYAPVDFDKCKFPRAAKAMAQGLEGIQASQGWDLPKAVEQLASKSRVSLNSIRQMRAGDRDPRRSADAVSTAIVALGGPKIIFPSQEHRTHTEADVEPTPSVPLAVNLPPGARGIRIEITFL
jgi:hypothetical protein